MILNHIEVTLTEADFNLMIDRYAPREGRVSRLGLDIRDGNLVVTGSVKVLLQIPFEVTMRLENDERCLIARLISLKPMRLITDQLKETILDKIVERMPTGVSREKDALFFDVNKILAGRGFAADLRLLSLHTANDAVTLELTGPLTFAEAIA